MLHATPAWAVLAVQADDTVADGATALEWDACAWGQTAAAGSCSGTPAALTWLQALDVSRQANSAAHRGHTDWRVPNRTELESLVQLNVNPTIDAAAFPNITGTFWSSTGYEGATSRAWSVDFTHGDSLPVAKTGAQALRLVRGGLAASAYTPKLTVILPLPGSPGQTAEVSVSSASGGCRFASPPQFVAPATVADPLPQGLAHLGDLFAFTLDGCAPGDTATIRITYPSLPADAQYWKHGPTHGNATAHWYPHPATVSGNTITFSITNGADGDDDLDASNSQIVDAGGPVVLGATGAAGATTAIPTLGEWGLLLLSGLLGALALRVQRRRFSIKNGSDAHGT